MTTFYLGTDRPNWLARPPWPALFLSWVAVHRCRHQATTRWALDSGGFTQVAKHGRYVTSPTDYATGVRRLATEVGLLDWAAIQDWPAAPPALAATGRTVDQHQADTVTSLLTLRTIAADLPWVPVLTGSTVADYLHHADAYAAAGIALADERTVAVGALVGTSPAHQAAVLEAVAALGLRLHGLGIKGATLRRCAPLLASADSMAWSLYARREHRPMCQPDAPHRRCSHCPTWAGTWAARTTARIGGTFQPSLFPLDNLGMPSSQ